MDTYAGTVIIVDDEEVVISYLTQALTLRGASVIPFTDGDKALESFLLMQAGSANPKVIVIDDKLMGSTITGLGIVGKIREVDNDSVLILISGSTIADEVRLAAGLRVDAFLQKPFTGEVLMDTIKQALARRSGSVVGDAVKSVTNGQQGGFLNFTREQSMLLFGFIMALVIFVGWINRIDAHYQDQAAGIARIEDGLKSEVRELRHDIGEERDSRGTAFATVDSKVAKVQGTVDAMKR